MARSLSMYDIFEQLRADEKNTKRTLHLTANENVMSELALSFCSSELGYRYHLGSFDDQGRNIDAPCYVTHNLMIRSFPSLLALEKKARDCACQMFQAAYCDFRCLSGMHAAIATILTNTKLGETVTIFSTESVGHHATISLLKHIGRNIEFMPWDFENHNIDLESFAKNIKRKPPTTIFFDFGTTFFPLPIEQIRTLVGPEVLMIYDASHVLGLIAGGQFQSPLKEGCDILIGNTHKTFPGPQKGVILYKDEQHGKKLADEIFASVLSTQHTHHTIALYITMIEMHQIGRAYAEQIIINNKAFAHALEQEGFSVFKSESHKLALVNGPFHEECGLLQKNGISANSRMIFNRPCIRFGVQEVTRKGMKASEMPYIASLIKRALSHEDVIQDVWDLTQTFSKIWSGDISEKMHVYC